VLLSFVPALGVTGCVLLTLEVDDADSDLMEWKSVPSRVSIQTLGTFGTVVLVVELDDTEPLPSIIGSKSVIVVAACGCGA
jgi:hypothetical protein